MNCGIYQIKNLKNSKIYIGSSLNLTRRKYYHVILYKDGDYKLFRIHQLVAIVWVPNPNGYKVVNHKDGDKLNNNDWNLEWTTQAQNIRHCKEVLGKNLNISFTKISQLYEENKNLNLDSFIELLKQNCK